jgi:AcrR family transcriptional regulator
MVDLLLEQGHLPSVQEVASRAGVSLSSVYRYFENLDELRVDTIARTRERYRPLFELRPPARGALADRARALVATRVTNYETLAPVARLVRARAGDQPSLSDLLAEVRREQQQQVAELFGSELQHRSPSEAGDLVVTVLTLTSFEAWDLQRALGRSASQIRRSWTAALIRLLSSG